MPFCVNSSREFGSGSHNIHARTIQPRWVKIWLHRLRGLWLIGHSLPGVKSEVPQRSILGPVVFNNFINDAQEATRLAFFKFVDDPILRRQLMCLRTGLLSRGTWADWKNMLAGAY